MGETFTGTEDMVFGMSNGDTILLHKMSKAWPSLTPSRYAKVSVTVTLKNKSGTINYGTKSYSGDITSSYLTDGKLYFNNFKPVVSVKKV